MATECACCHKRMEDDELIYPYPFYKIDNNRKVSAIAKVLCFDCFKKLVDTVNHAVADWDFLNKVSERFGEEIMKFKEKLRSEYEGIKESTCQ